MKPGGLLVFFLLTVCFFLDVHYWTGPLFRLNYTAWCWAFICALSVRVEGKWAYAGAACCGLALEIAGGPGRLAFFLAGAFALREGRRLAGGPNSTFVAATAAFFGGGLMAGGDMAASALRGALTPPLAGIAAVCLSAGFCTAAAEAVGECVAWGLWRSRDRAPKIRLVGYGYRKV